MCQTRSTGSDPLVIKRSEIFESEPPDKKVHVDFGGQDLGKREVRGGRG